MSEYARYTAAELLAAHRSIVEEAKSRPIDLSPMLGDLALNSEQQTPKIIPRTPQEAFDYLLNLGLKQRDIGRAMSYPEKDGTRSAMSHWYNRGVSKNDTKLTRKLLALASLTDIISHEFQVTDPETICAYLKAPFLDVETQEETNLLRVIGSSEEQPLKTACVSLQQFRSK